MTKKAKRTIAIILAIISVVSVFSIGFVAIANAAEMTAEDFEDVYMDYDDELTVDLVELNWYNAIKNDKYSSSKITDKVANNFDKKCYVDLLTETEYLVHTLNNTTVVIQAVNTPLTESTMIVPKYVNMYYLVYGDVKEIEDDEEQEGCGYKGYFTLENGEDVRWDFSDEIKTAVRYVEEYDDEKEDFVKVKEEYETAPTVEAVAVRNSQVVGIEQSFAGDQNPELKTVLLPSDLKTIADGAFKSNQYIENVYGPDVTEIKKEAFYDCKDLNNCVMPNVRYVGERAYYKDNRLNSFNFESCLKIGKEAFFDCVKFEILEFNENLQELGQGAFKQCTGLKEVYIPSGVSINTIPAECFYLCTSLETIEFSKEIINIGSQAFFNCYSLNVLDLRTTQLEKIESKAFWGCTNLEYVILPKSMVSFATDSFEKCDALRYICFAGQLSDSQIKKIKASELGSCTITKVDTEGPALYDAETKRKITDKKLKVNHPITVIICDAVDVTEAYLNENDLDLELSSEINGYKTYVATVDVDYEDVFEIRAIDFFGNESKYEITYTEDPIQYTVKFDGNGATGGSVADLAMTGEEEKNLPQNGFEKAGFSFAGWSFDKTAKKADFADKEAVIDLTSVDGDVVTLYAVWTPNDCVVRYNANGGNNEMIDTKFNFGSSVTLASNLFTKTGYTFRGWATTADGTAVYTNKQKITPDTLDANNAYVLYAVWSPNAYTVKFDANGAKGEIAAINAKYDQEFEAPQNTFEREGFTFAGWALSKGQTDSFIKEGEKVKNLSDKANGTVTLYAIWTSDAYSVVFHSNTPIEETRTQDISVTKKTELIPNPFERTGYDFAGWSKTADGQPEYKNKAVVTHLAEGGEKVDLYAVWTPHKYSIKFSSNGATGTMGSVEAVYDVEKQLPECAYVKDGYRFVGWAQNPVLMEVVYADGQIVKNLVAKNNGTITLYAVWANNAYNVVFNSNDGTDRTATQAIAIDKQTNLTKNTFTKKGYEFMGWSLTADGEMVYADKAAVRNIAAQDETVNLYAVWQPITYTITLSGNGAKNVVLENKFNATYDQTFKLPQNEYYRAGYIFGGWTTKAGAAALFKDEDEVLNLTEKKDITLYAVWNKITMGDVDGDGNVSPADARSALRMSVQLDEFTYTSLAFAASDTDNDGRITPADARKILRVSVQLEKFR